MHYEAELQFLQRILRQLNLPSVVFCPDSKALPRVDMGLRASLGLPEATLPQWKKDYRLVYYTDEFRCHYAVVQLPGPEASQALVVGPYVSENTDLPWIKALMDRCRLPEDHLPILENFYRQVRYIGNDNSLFAALQALAEHIWGQGQFLIERVEQGVPELWTPIDRSPEAKPQDNILNRIHLIEQRYQAENHLMELIRQGRGQKAQMMLSQFSSAALERRGEPARDIKNYTIIMNTLMRKAAEQAGVHPSYIDRLSSDFARQIEIAGDWDSFLVLWKEMARRYCLMVRRHSMKDFSPTVQKVISRIDFDLAADLSLKASAQALNVNPSYLSTLFKKETGETLTDFVNRRRMEHAAYLLTSTQLSVSSVALNCGISDDNYFTKLFKRFNGLTPTQFRQDQHLRK